MSDDELPATVCKECRAIAEQDPVNRRLARLALESPVIQAVFLRYRHGTISRDEALITCAELLFKRSEAYRAAFLSRLESGVPAVVPKGFDDE